MRIIVESFKETLELGLQKPEQIVVRAIYPILGERDVSSVAAHYGGSYYLRRKSDGRFHDYILRGLSFRCSS